MSPAPAPSVRLAASCPLCRQSGRERFRAHGYGVLDCLGCGHRFAGLAPSRGHVAAVYGEDYFQGGGAGYADYAAEADLLRAHGRRYADRIAPLVAAAGGLGPTGNGAGRMLDIGAACGFVLDGFAERGWHGTGIEPNPTMAERGRRAGRDVRVGTAERLDALGDDPPFDLVTMIQVVAHFHDPGLAFANLRDRTRPGGWWLIETWDHRSLAARLAGRRWHEYSPPSVLHWFTRERLATLVAGYGFSVVAHGRPRKSLRGSHARSLLRYKLGDSALGRWLSPALSLIPASAEIPYPADDLFWLLCRRD